MRIFHALPLLLVLFLGMPCLPAQVRSFTFVSRGRVVTYERFSSSGPEAPLLMVLPGSSGPGAPFYRDQAAFFAAKGFDTLLLHYFDAARSQAPSKENYEAWAAALADLVRETRASAPARPRPVFVVGYSLGASVALAAGSQLLPVNGMAIWYGSLPDTFFFKLKGMPPLLILHGSRDSNIPVYNAQQLIRLCGIDHFDCESHIYPDQDHGFSSPALEDAEQRTLDFFAARRR